jgi:hypothetical protein
MDSRIEKIKEILDKDCLDKTPIDENHIKECLIYQRKRCWCCHKNDALAERIAEVK